MAVNYSDFTPGTEIIWKNTGGTYAMNLKNLANAGIREGAKSATLLDGTKGMPEFLEVVAGTKFGSAPAAGLLCLIYLAFSRNATAGTDNPMGLTGADAAVGNADQLGGGFIGAIVLSNALGTAAQRSFPMIVPVRGSYVIPVFQNSSALSTTNVDGDSYISMVPWYRRTPIA